MDSFKNSEKLEITSSKENFGLDIEVVCPKDDVGLYLSKYESNNKTIDLNIKKINKKKNNSTLKKRLKNINISYEQFEDIYQKEEEENIKE